MISNITNITFVDLGEKATSCMNNGVISDT